MDAVTFTTRNVGETIARPGSLTQRLDQSPAEPVNIEPRVIPIRNYGPTCYEAVTVVTTVIYWPEDIAGERHYTPRSTPSSGLDELPKYLSTGGSIVSVHQPTEALAWLEANYDTHRLVRFIRKKFRCPVAALIFPDEPGLTIFGPHSEPIMARLAQKLANASQFPVMSRPAAANPALTFYPRVPQGKTLARIGHLLRDEGLNRGLPSLNSAHTDSPAPPDGLIGNVSTSSGHSAGASLEDETAQPREKTSKSEAEEWEEWASPIHWKQTGINIQTSDPNCPPIQLEIRSLTQFRTFSDRIWAPENPLMRWATAKAQAQVHTTLRLEFPRKEVTLDRSYATLGLEGHRGGSILYQENLSDFCSFVYPTEQLQCGFWGTRPCCCPYARSA
ncbi:hypothetical protein C8R46DRAFT_417217 [Mycena filopes]|nr:hypothetical protein C8R46DRAFT_417217 [Mycena filopes]